MEKCKIHAEYDPKLGGMNVQLSGKGWEIITLAAVLVNRIANELEKQPKEMLAIIGGLFDTVQEATECSIGIDLGAISRAMEERDG